MSKPSPKKKKKKHTPWDKSFKQLMSIVLADLGLKVLQDVILGDLPLEADLVLISQAEQPTTNEWKDHPLWQYCTDQVLVEFKSVGDKFSTGDFEKLLAYTLLYRIKYQVSYTSELSSWLVLPALNRPLKAALKHYKLELEEILPGFWRGQTLFPLYIVAYNDLPFEGPYQMLKLFIKSGQPVQNVFADMLQSLQRPSWLKAVQQVMELIHPKDFREVLLKVGLSTERKELRETIKELLKDDIEKEKRESKLEGKLESALETAKKMIAEGFEDGLIARVTGLAVEDITALRR